MAGCMPCFIIPLLLFIFHRFIQPYLLKIWNPWGDKVVKDAEDCKFSCECSWNKNKSKEVTAPDSNTQRVNGDKEDKEIESGKEKVS